MCGCSASEIDEPNDVFIIDTIYDIPYQETTNEIEIQTPQIIYQYDAGYAAGCEAAALTMCLNCYGFDVTIDDIILDYLSYGNTEECYIGDIYTIGWCYPSAIVSAANKYFEDEAVSDTFAAQEITGSSFDEFLEYIDKGPVITWFTIDYNLPLWYSSEVWSNEHCILVYDYDDTYVYVADSISGFTKIEINEFQEIWEMCGSYGVIITTTLEQ